MQEKLRVMKSFIRSNEGSLVQYPLTPIMENECSQLSNEETSQLHRIYQQNILVQDMDGQIRIEDNEDPFQPSLTGEENDLNVSHTQRERYDL
mmetsp:Transcript_10370/g.17413  ORF Transcript_10370/g.17413 Transcript_10370/m.17413 type:complete len:93 (-) Transcript_10370:893-1171(-)